MGGKFIWGLLIFGFSQLVSSQQLDWSPEKKDQVIEKCNEYLTETLLIYQNGSLIFDYGDDTKLYHLFSIRKSLVSLLYGIYEDTESIDINSSLKSLNIDDKEGLSAQEKEATILDLLKSKSGIYHPAAFETPGMKKKRPLRESHKPGEFWYYNNWDFNALVTIFEKQTGKGVFEAFQEKIAKPLNFQDFDLDAQDYHKEEGVSIHSAALWSLSGRDLMTLGVTLLNSGIYDHKQVIPSEWIQKSSSAHSDLGMFGGYGLCWWVALDNKHYPFVDLPDGTFSARGTGEQNLVIIPELNMVIVHLTEVKKPLDRKMKVTEFGRLLKQIFE